MRSKPCVLNYCSQPYCEACCWNVVPSAQVLGLITESTNEGHFRWTIPPSLQSGQYVLRVVGHTHNEPTSSISIEIADEVGRCRSQHFCIVMSPRLTYCFVPLARQGLHVHEPKFTSTSSQNWVQGHSYDVSWTSEGLQEFLTLVLQPGAVVLAHNAPTSGTVTVTVPVDTAGMADGGAYTLQLKNAAGAVLARSSTLRVYHQTTVTVTQPAESEDPGAEIAATADVDIAELAAVWDKGASYYARWQVTGLSSTVSLQLYHGSPDRRTAGGVFCVPFEDPATGVVHQDCVTDPLSSYFGHCATSTTAENHFQSGDVCMPLRDHFQLVWSTNVKASMGEHYLKVASGSSLPGVGDDYYLVVVQHGQVDRYGKR